MTVVDTGSQIPARQRRLTDRKQLHRLSNVRPDLALGDCAECGPDARLVYRAYRDLWACRTSVYRSHSYPRNRKKRGNSQRKYALSRRGVTPADYVRMHTAQGGVCAICRETESIPGRELSVDHCHETGRIRGLLCCLCNRALGQFKDDPELLEAAATYLRK